MDGRRRHNRTGLLTIHCFCKCCAVLSAALLLPLSTAALSAQELNQPRILIDITADQPIAGSTWTLTLLIPHSEPNEVTVLAPHFDDALLLDQVLKGPRLSNPVTGQAFAGQNQLPFVDQTEDGTASERWTAMEYRFVLNSPGTVPFGAFTIITPQGQAKTEPFSLEVQSPPRTNETRQYQLVWESMPPSIKTGESAVISLRVNRWNAATDHSEAQLPAAVLFLPSVPQGLILESLPILTEEKSAGTVLKFRIIPLDAVPFVLERRQLSHNGAIFEIPALRISVGPAAYERAESIIQAVPDEEIQAENSNPPPFPVMETATAGNSRLYQRYQTEYETIYIATKNLWEQGCYANALAILRQNERDHSAGSLFAVIRREAELALGFFRTNDEKRQNPLVFWETKTRCAVLRETAVHRIPDSAGEVIGYFMEGQPVLISSSGVIPENSGNTAARPLETWLRVTANDSGGFIGWVPEESVIFY